MRGPRWAIPATGGADILHNVDQVLQLEARMMMNIIGQQ